jgi:hypothetical protein
LYHPGRTDILGVLGKNGLNVVFLLNILVVMGIEGVVFFGKLAVEVEKMVENKYEIKVTCCIVLM